MQEFYMTSCGNYELYHSGIKGMKWGIRRYQNEDGSLTEEGKKRYAKLVGKIDKQQRKIDKYQKRIDRNAGKDYRAEKKLAKANKLQNKAAKLHNKAVNGWLISDKKRTKLEIKSQKLSAKAGKLSAKAEKMQNSTSKNEAKIHKAQSLINKYSRKIAKFAPESTYAGAQFINGQYKTKLEDINSKMDAARKYNRYSTDFLEIVQNKEVADKGGKELQKAYRQYLDNPEKFATEDANKLKDRG